MTQVFNRYPTGGGEFALALAIADYAWADGTNIFPGVDRLAVKSRQSVRSVQMQLRRMVAIGWLVEVKDKRGGRGKNTKYCINPSWLKGAELAPFIDPEKGASSASERVQSDALKGATDGSAYITVLTVNTPLPPKGGAPGVETQTGEPGPGFNAVAAEYPRQVDLHKARAVWDKIAPDARLQGEMLQSIRAWIRTPEWQRENGRFIPKFGNWLRARRWLDVPGIAAPSPQPAKVPAPVPALTQEQLAANGEKARAVVARARALMRVVGAGAAV